jgi:hypothetical protein
MSYQFTQPLGDVSTATIATDIMQGGANATPNPIPGSVLDPTAWNAASPAPAAPFSLPSILNPSSWGTSSGGSSTGLLVALAVVGGGAYLLFRKKGRR